MAHALIFALTFVPSFFLGRVSGNRFRDLVAGLLPDTFGSLMFFMAVLTFVAMTIDGVVGRLVPEFLHQPFWFLLTGFGSGTLIAAVRSLFREKPEAPPAFIHYNQPGLFRPSSALPPEDFVARR
jgi:MFS family permease